MAELADKRREQFCKLRAVGTKQAEAYSRAGYRTGDRSNASKLEQHPEISERITELRAEELQRQQQIRLQSAERDGLTELKAAIAGAAATGNWAAVVSGSKALGEADGSLDALRQPDEKMTIGEMLSLAVELDPGFRLWAIVAERLMLIDGKTGKAMPPWTDGRGRPVPPYLNPETYELVE
jgi:hypothetical protein